MAVASLRAESVRRNPITPAQRALIEAQLEAWIDLLDQLDGDPDFEADDSDLEDSDDDSCEAGDDLGGQWFLPAWLVNHQ
jgi:hypothetical protein